MFWSFKISFDLIFSTISNFKNVCTLRAKGKPLSFARFFNTIILLAHSSLNETKYLYFLFFALVGPSFSAGILFLKIEEGVKKIYGAD